MSEAFEAKRREALADDLDRVRRRGIDRIDLETGTQPYVALRVLGFLLQRGPWDGWGRPYMIRAGIEAALPYVPSPQHRSALAAFYGIGQHGGLTSAERDDRGKALLKVPSKASKETAKLAIREARYALADALLTLERRGFQLPDAPIGEAEAASTYQTVLAELQALRSDLGISPKRAEDEAPMLLELPGTIDQLARLGRAGSPGAAAMAFLECASRRPELYPDNVGEMIVMLLNLTQTRRPYEQRRDDWITRHIAFTDDAYPEREERAFSRFADLIVSMMASPCGTDGKADTAFAKNIEGLLERLAYGDGGATAEDVIYRLQAALPRFRRLGELQETTAQVPAQWLSSLIGLVGPEWVIWEKQYQHYLDPHEEFLDITTGLRPLLLKADALEDPFTQTLAWARDASTAAHFENPRLRDKHHLDVPRADWERALELADLAARRSLNLLAQVIAYNERTDYWFSAATVFRSADYAPRFPIVPVSHLKPVKP